MSSPAITLTATLDDVAGNRVGSAGNPSKLCIALCNFGPQLPRIAGTTLLAKVGPIFIESTDGTINTKLWGNDVISPAGTYYTVSILDGQGNVVQCAAYQVTGSGIFDLSSLVPIVPPYGFPAGVLAYNPCTGSGLNWTAPGQVVAASYNGILLPQGASFPINSYTLDATGMNMTLNFLPETGDRIDAICIT